MQVRRELEMGNGCNAVDVKQVDVTGSQAKLGLMVGMALGPGGGEKGCGHGSGNIGN